MSLKMPKKQKLLFWVEALGETVDDADPHEFGPFVGDDLEWAASEYADYFHSNRDGWECSWPIVFSIADESGKLLAKVEVEREARPHFSGRVLKQASDDSQPKEGK